MAVSTVNFSQKEGNLYESDPIQVQSTEIVIRVEMTGG